MFRARRCGPASSTTHSSQGTEGTIIGGTVWVLAQQWLAKLVVAGLSLALVFVMARVMGPEDFGYYSFLLSASALVALPLDAGFRNLLLREQVRPTPGLAASGVCLPGQAYGHVLLAGLVALALVLLWPPLQHRAYVFVVVLAIVSGLAQLSSARMIADGELSREATWQVWSRLASGLPVVAALWLLTQAPEDLLGCASLGLLCLLPLFPQRWRVIRGCLPGLASYRAAFGFFWIDVATTAYHRLDMVLLQHFLGQDPAIGHFAAAFRLFDGVQMLVAPVALLLFRHLRLHHEDRAMLGASVRLALLLAALTGCMLALGAWQGGSLVARLLFGPEFAAAGPLIAWLFLGFVVVLPNYVLTQAAVAMNFERCYAWSCTVAVPANIGLNVLLIPRFGALGATWALCVTELVLMAGLVWGLRSALRRPV